MRCQRFGLTLVEVLVLLVVIGILLGLLIPAIPRSRGPARRSQCATHQKNFALASIQYEGAKGRLPGYVMDFGRFESKSDPTTNDTGMRSHRKIGTWGVAVLPWLDAQPTYEHWTEDRYPILLVENAELDPTTGFSGEGFHPLAAANLAIFQCPSNPVASGSHAKNSYIANNGMFHRNRTELDEWQLQRAEGSVSIDFARSMAVANGAFNNQFRGLDEKGMPVPIGPPVTLADFKDGQGYTLLFTENVQALPWHRAGFIDADDLVLPEDGSEVRYEPTSRFVHGAVWHFEDDQNASGAPKVKSVHRINGNMDDTASGDIFTLTMNRDNAADLARPSSAHVDGVNAGMADGATRFITESIDYRVYQALLTPRGTQSDVPEQDFVLSDDAL